MNANPIKELGQEHFHILQMIGVIRPVVQKLKSGEAVAKDHLQKIADFIVNYADKLHHGKEEAILFVELEKRQGVNLALVNELVGEHGTGRDLIGGLKAALGKYEPGKPEAYHVATSLSHYGELIKEHIRKENGLFAQAMEMLSKEEQAKMVVRFAGLEKEMAKDTTQALKGLEELKKAYLLIGATGTQNYTKNTPGLQENMRF